VTTVAGDSVMARRPDAERVVTPLELFFDLVYVFAIGQLSGHLLEHVDARTGAETAILTLAVVYAWYMTAWAANWLDPGRLPVRLLLIALMFASLLMSAGIGEAFGDRAWLFVVGYLVLQLGRTAFLIVVLRGGPLGEHFVNALVWELAAGALWVAGALAGSDDRLWWWAGAVAVTYAGALALHWLPGRGQRIDVHHSGIAGDHLLERLRLFFLITLGEVVLTMGTAFAHEPFTAERLLALAISFAGAVAIWWCYFQNVEDTALGAVARADDAGAVSWSGTTTLTLGVLALIAIAVGGELAIGHPGEETHASVAALVFGGPALFLVGQLLFLLQAARRTSVARGVAVAVLAVLGIAAAALGVPLIVSTAAASAVLVAVALADTVASRRG
jgi:low temperature requirement protein LtrA